MIPRQKGGAEPIVLLINADEGRLMPAYRARDALCAQKNLTPRRADRAEPRVILRIAREDRRLRREGGESRRPDHCLTTRRGSDWACSAPSRDCSGACRKDELSLQFLCMKLVNVRLDDEDARAVARLRAKGVSLSDVVRRAVRAEDQRTASRKVRSEQIVAEALDRFPTPRKPPRRVSALDRRAVQELVRSRLRRSS